MKKLMLLAAMLALVLAVVVPALAQTSQELGNETESGDVSLSFNVTGSGSNGSQCVTPLQFGNTGNLQNSQGFLQYNSIADDLEAEGPEFSFAPVLSGGCEQTVQQSSAASSN